MTRLLKPFFRKYAESTPEEIEAFNRANFFLMRRVELLLAKNEATAFQKAA